MALQSSGQIGLGDIALEMGLVVQNISLTAASTSSTLNDASPSKPNESQPHGMAEFYSYDHSYSSLKTLMGGANNISGGKWFAFCEDKISFFYYHDGGKAMPMVGDKLYSSNRDEYIPFPSALTKIGAALQGPEEEIYYVATTDSTGTITRLDSCEGIEGGGFEPAPGDGDTLDPNPGLEKPRG